MQRHSPLNWELCNKAWRGGAGSVCGIQIDGNMDPLVKKACVWADGGFHSRVKGEQRGATLLLKAVMTTWSSRVRLQEPSRDGSPPSRSPQQEATCCMQHC